MHLGYLLLYALIREPDYYRNGGRVPRCGGVSTGESYLILLVGSGAALGFYARKFHSMKKLADAKNSILWKKIPFRQR